MKHSGTSLWSRGYQPGNNWMMCQLCGLRFRASEMLRQPHGQHRGLWVCRRDYDAYNPQYEDLKPITERLLPRKLNPEPAITTIEFTGVAEGGGDGSGSSKITADDL
jgi:hypothetical protein